MKINKKILFFLLSSSLALGACSAPTDVTNATENSSQTELAAESAQIDTSIELEEKEEQSAEAVQSEEKQTEASSDGYKTITVDGSNMSGYREPNVRVDIGFGDREYWGFTNETGQLVRVIADEIILQDDATESVTSDGRYYSDEAKVPGVESSTLDEGHVIADSLGGVSNAYNITPQDSVLNRHGDQAYMERNIREAGGATDFEAIITYPDAETHIPSKYNYTYTILGNKVVDEYENVNPDEYNEQQGLTGAEKESVEPESAEPIIPIEGDMSTVDTNGNGTVTIDEAKSAGYSMPITSDHWLYQYMRDTDKDGMVGE